MNRQISNCFGERARLGRSSTRLASNSLGACEKYSARGRAEPQPGRLRSPFILILLAAVLLFTTNIFAADFDSDFSTANKLYAEGKFADAASLYEKILSSGETSANLLFNDGNAEFKAGKLGQAIVAFRRAELLAPRDAEIRANLNFVRNRVQGATVRENRWQTALGQLSLNHWTLLTAIAFWLTFILLVARQLRPALAPRLKSVTTFFAVLTILFGVGLSVQAANHFSKQTAVVISAEATARSGPFDDAQTTFTLHDGAELSVLDRHGDWFQVADGAGKSGWLNKKEIAILPGA